MAELSLGAAWPKVFASFRPDSALLYDMYPTSEIFRRPSRFFSALLLFAFTASTGSAQCYEFAGSGATLKIDISSFASHQDDQTDSNGGYTSKDTFEGNNSLTVGGTTKTTISTANTPDCVGCLLGSAVFSYSSGLTVFTMSVPADDSPGSMNAWFATLGGVGNVIPTGVLPSPQAFPPISSWAVEPQITVAVGGNLTDYPITSIGPCSNSSSGGPAPSISGVVSASAFGAFAAVAPGSGVEIYGSALASDTQGWTGSDFTGNNAPTMLDGVSVSIAGQAAFVDYVSPTQVNAELPSNIATSGPLQLTVSNSNGASAAVNVTLNTTEPGLLAPTSFKIGGNQYVVAQHSDGSYVLPVGAISGVTSSPAKPGETVVIYGVGFGSVIPNIPAGEIATDTNQLSAPFEVLFGQTPAKLPYFGLAPSFVGLYQFNVTVPALAASDLTPLTFNLGGVTGTQKLYTAVQ
jgi:uncharacterized protein (TIGR03437 family)